MCLAIPGIIASIQGSGLERSGDVAFGTVQQRVSLAYVPEAGIGDYVVVHAGCAISVLDEEAALDTLATFADWQRADPETGQ
jgi:hydrogenase expression/formation protein HypC